MNPDIDFGKIIPRGGDERLAFEELSYLLFAKEFADEGVVVRREGSGGDGGLEAYVADLKGRPRVGLQAKFFPDKFEDGQWRKIKESGETAIRRNRETGSLELMVFTVPRNLNEAEQKKWLTQCGEWNKLAKDEGYEQALKFEFWSESALRGHILEEGNRGLHLHYFGFPDFDSKRCQEVTRSNVRNLRDRHLPELHVETDAEDEIHTFLRTERFRQRFLESGRKSLKLLLDPPGAEPNWSEATKALYVEFTKAARAVQDHLGNGIEIPASLSELGKGIKIAENRLNPLVDQLRSDLPPREPRNRGQQSAEEKCYDSFATLRSKASSFQHFVEDSGCADAHCLLLTGRPGEGKTHVLAEICTRYAEEGGVALFFEGRIFDPAKLPWETILRGADFPAMSLRDFLATFEALNPTNGLKSLICIDALNETTDRSFWQTHLIPFAEEVCRFSGIKLIVSCRTDFASQTIPTDIAEGQQEHWAIAEHNGLGISIVDALPKYFKEYDLKGFQIPPLAREFNTPLFLKIFCETYEGQSPAVDHHTLPAILRAYSDRKFKAISKRIDCDLEQVADAVRAIAQGMAQRENAVLSTVEAREICEQHFAAIEASRSLLRALLSEDVLSEAPGFQQEPVGTGSGNIRFTYERTWDYFYSLQILPFKHSPDDNLCKMVCDDQWRSANPGLLSMLAIRLPQEIGIELAELLPTDDVDYFTGRASEESLAWRTHESWSPETSKFLEAITDDDEGRKFELLVQFALNPNHPRNGEFLHEMLMAIPFAERDRTWTLWLNRVLVDYRSLYGIEELFAWAGVGDLKAIPDETLLLIGTTLAWMSTTTSRASRTDILDKLLRVLAGKTSVAASLLERVVEADDPYVIEAVLFACLGCCQQLDADKEGVAKVAQITFEKFFAAEFQPPHILLRHYASEICSLAIAKGLLGNNPDRLRILPPWNTKPLRVWSAKRLNKKVAEFEEAGRAGSRVSTLLASVEPNTSGGFYGNFGRYVMEGRVERFLNVRLDQKPPEPIKYSHRFGAQRAKRFIVQRVFEIGWDPEKIDLNHSNEYHLRDKEKTERLSKKYQWIALHELIGTISDHYHFTGWEDHVRKGTSAKEFCEYDISEPFLPDSLRNHEVKKWSFAKMRPPWWLGGLEPFPRPLSLESKRIFANEVNTSDPLQLLELSDGECDWLTLDGYARWSEPLPVWEDDHACPEASISWAFRSYLVPPENFDQLVMRLSKKELANGLLWVSEPEFGKPSHQLQDYPDGQTDLAELCLIDNDIHVRGWNTGGISTTCRFSPDTEGDNALKGSIPSPQLAEIGSLSWSGVGLRFQNRNSGNIAFKSFGDYPKGSGVVKREALRNWLSESGLRIVWRCFGEKHLMNDHPNRNGRAYWMAFSLNLDGTIARHHSGTIRFPNDWNTEEPVEWVSKI